MKNKKTPQSVKEFLLKTGFPFEMSVAKIFRENEYKVEIGSFFLDLEEDKMREIDIIATKKIGDVNIVFIVECKQSNRDAWIFVASENNPTRYWKYVKKYRPEIDFEAMKKCFSKSHFLDRNIPLANNYITFNGDKQSESVALNDAVKKSIKGTVSIITDYEYDYGEKEKTLFFSTVFFSGDIFLATYNKTLNVKEISHLLLKNNFTSSAYSDISDNNSGNNSFFSHATTLGENISWEERRKREKINKTKHIYTSLKPEFILDIVKDTFIKKYIKLVEKEVSGISIKFWKKENKKQES